jgi:mono/diheme cytochrome c family protein
MASVRPSRAKVLLLITATVGVAASGTVLSQSAPPKDEVTFTRDIAPILQRSCQSCHRPDGAGPMPLLTYEDARPYARAIKTKTGLGPHAGVMPPWFVEKNIGIQKFKNDPSLSDEEIAKIAKWADSGAPRGNPPTCRRRSTGAGRGSLDARPPDLIVKSQEIRSRATARSVGLPGRASRPVCPRIAT